MMLLRPMRADEFAAYLDYFIPDYAAEIAANYRLSESEAREQARREISVSLPDGVNSAGHVLLCLVDSATLSDNALGYLWYKADAAMREAFIYDFYIRPDHQGKGLGKQALQLLEEALKARGFAQIKLRVAGDNERARHLYEVSGFQVTGINMSKPL
ncbi:MAG: GNAT family N-acetyltransferase [Aeromonas sp.]